MSSVDYQQAMFDRTVLFRACNRCWRAADLLVMPTISRTALRLTRICSHDRNRWRNI